MKRFCNEIAIQYSKERVETFDEIKKNEWSVVRKYLNSGQRILDLCCGPGTFLIPLTKEGYNVEGIDFPEEMLKQAIKFAKKEKIEVVVSLGMLEILEGGMRYMT